MKAIHIFKTFLWTTVSVILMTACEKDGDTIFLSSIESSDLIASESNVALSLETSKQVVLSLAWTKSTLSVSNPDMSAPDILSTYVQASTDRDFSTNTVESLEKSLSKAYTGAELNTLAKSLGMSPDVETPVYFRLKVLTGSNSQPVYSNVTGVGITSYFIDMSIGFVLDKDKAETGNTLSSPLSDGIYKGFMGASGWYNFYLSEGDGTVWGNEPADGSEFTLSSAEGAWNCWFPGITGCYYVTFNTVNKTWSSLLLPALTVSGDIEAEMKFDRPTLRWTSVFNASGASTLKIKLNADGKLYDYSTKTDDALAQDTPVAFAGDGTNLTFASQAADIEITVPAAGEYTLVVDLSNPNAWTCNAVSGSEEPEEIIRYLYLPGIDDGINISGSWTFDNFLSLYNEDEAAYAGVVNVNSLWGYSINTEKDNWDDKYTVAEGDAYAGTLVLKGETNLPAPDPGLYLIEVSTKSLTYNLFGLTDKIYVVGLHDVWEFNVTLPITDTPGVYAGDITINSASPWGFTIHPVDGDWDRKFGGSDGNLYYRGNNITDDASLAPGTYRMTVDLINQTYSITQ